MTTLQINDEELARRLQDEEQASLLVLANPLPAGLTINGNTAERRTAKMRYYIQMIIGLPQVTVGLAMALLFWNENTPHCDETFQNRIKIWVVLTIVRLAVYMSAITHLYRKFEQPIQPIAESAYPYYHRLKKIISTLELINLMWFLIGNLWVLSVNKSPGCQQTIMYQLALAILIIAYIQLCLPCLLTLLMIPLIVICLPCIIHVLARMQANGGLSSKGASDRDIDLLPVRTLEVDDASESCAICLSSFKANEVLKQIPICKHEYHTDCLREWLKVNATCPTCRQSIHATPGQTDIEMNQGTESKV